jgi:hypothetical protein
MTAAAERAGVVVAAVDDINDERPAYERSLFVTTRFVIDRRPAARMPTSTAGELALVSGLLLVIIKEVGSIVTALAGDALRRALEDTGHPGIYTPELFAAAVDLAVREDYLVRLGSGPTEQIARGASFRH